MAAAATQNSGGEGLQPKQTMVMATPEKVEATIACDPDEPTTREHR